MSFTIWTPLAVASEAYSWQGSIWRMVEAQHIASTMKIVDDPGEQDLLEQLLEANKPPLPITTVGLDPLLATPFRYDPLRQGSRFRSVIDPGVFYGAESVRTAGAELGYWRWRFLNDALDLDKLAPVPHTAFRSEIRTEVIDLRRPPFQEDESVWRHKTDYTATQAFARVARESHVGGIVYQSVRDPDSGWCLAVMTPQAFAKPKPHPSMQTWWLAVYSDKVIWRREQASITFLATDF